MKINLKYLNKQKLLSLSLASILTFSLTGCGKQEVVDDNSQYDTINTNTSDDNELEGQSLVKGLTQTLG